MDIEPKAIRVTQPCSKTGNKSLCSQSKTRAVIAVV